MKCECPLKGYCKRRDAYVPRHQWQQCQNGQVEHVDKVIEAIQRRVIYNQKKYLANLPVVQCVHQQGPNCEIASEIAGTPCETNLTVCNACIRCDRPKRLNIHTATLASLHNPEIDISKIQSVIDGSSSGFGTKLANTFGLFLKKTKNCSCAGHQDILDVWTPDYVRQNMDRVVQWLEDEARKRKLPFSRFLTHTLISALLLTEK